MIRRVLAALLIAAAAPAAAQTFAIVGGTVALGDGTQPIPNGIQRLNQEAAKALGDGIRAGLPNLSEAVAWTWLSRNPAKALGILDKTGTLAPGKMADVVLWNGDPFSDYSRPERVWIDGALMYDARDPKRRPVSDFELGQPGAGDVK